MNSNTSQSEMLSQDEAIEMDVSPQTHSEAVESNRQTYMMQLKEL